MATYFSNQFAAAGTDVTALDSAYRASQGALGGHLVYSIARATTASTSAADVIRMVRGVHSSSRLFSMTLQFDGTSVTAGTVDVGLHLSDLNHDGAVVTTGDVFEDGLVISGGVSQVDVFTGNVLTNLDRGKTLWELAAADGASYTEDPNVLFDITITTAVGIATTVTPEIMLVAGFLLTD